LKSEPDIAAILPAAGESERMGGRNKLLLPWSTSTVIGKVIESLLEAGIANIVVTLGHDAENVRQSIQHAPVKIFYNPLHGEGMSTSIVQGVKLLPEGDDGIMIALADMPAVRPATLSMLCAQFREHGGSSIIVPVHEKQQGNPVIFPGSLRSELLRLDGDRGAKEILRKHNDRVVRVPTEDPGVCMDVDTMEAYEAMTNDERPKDR